MGLKVDIGPRRRTFDISIGIPAYARCDELRELLESIYNQTLLPAEITICEDNSPERPFLRAIAEEWRERLVAEDCDVNYIENDHNLGYDGNLRKVISSSHCSWVLLIGNDDLLLRAGIERVEEFLKENGEIKVISRTFVRFHKDVQKPIGVSRISSTDQVFSALTSSSKMIFRTSGFIGGLIVNRKWANSLDTDQYDGTLFYQIYLSSVAFCGKGIGYIAKPVVAARAGNPPLFGSAGCEKDVHVPGSYTPKGRAKMWASVLRIAGEIGIEHGLDLTVGLKEELGVRSSFLVFEALAGSDRGTLSEMRRELESLNLFAHPIPRALFLVDWILGSKARPLYSLVRLVLQ